MRCWRLPRRSCSGDSSGDGVQGQADDRRRGADARRRSSGTTTSTSCGRARSQLGVNLVVLNADNKPDQMVKSLEDLVARPVDGIIFTPYWATAARGLTLAKDANIPVILTDSYPPILAAVRAVPELQGVRRPERRGCRPPDGGGVVRRDEARRQRQEGDRRRQRHGRHVGRHRPAQGPRRRAEGPSRGAGRRRGRRQFRARHVADGVRVALPGPSRHQGRVGCQRRHGDRRDDRAQERRQAARQGRAWSSRWTSTRRTSMR